MALDKVEDHALNDGLRREVEGARGLPAAGIGGEWSRPPRLTLSRPPPQGDERVTDRGGDADECPPDRLRRERREYGAW